VLLKEAKVDSAHIVKPNSDAMPPKEVTGDRYQLSGEIARGGMAVVLRGCDVAGQSGSAFPLETGSFLLGIN